MTMGKGRLVRIVMVVDGLYDLLYDWLDDLMDFCSGPRFLPCVLSLRGSRGVSFGLLIVNFLTGHSLENRVFVTA